MTAPINLHDYERRAQELMPAEFWDYTAGGVLGEITVGRNRRASQPIRRMNRSDRSCFGLLLATELIWEALVPLAPAFATEFDLADRGRLREARGRVCVPAANRSLMGGRRTAPDPLPRARLAAHHLRFVGTHLDRPDLRPAHKNARRQSTA